MSDYKRTIVNCVTMLAEAFGRKISGPMVEAYQIGLSGLAPEQVEIASAAALRQSKFMPSPSELREFGGAVRITDRAERAWIAFDDAISKTGGYKTLMFDDVVINAVVRSLGGVASILDMEASEYQSFFRGKFLKAYEALARSRVGAEQCGPLIGYFDQTNGRSGDPIVIKVGLPALPGMPAVGSDGKFIEQSQPALAVPRVTLKKA